MQISSVDFYLDGGTAKVVTDDGTFYIDRRLGSKTPCSIWNLHPDEDRASRRDDVRQALTEALHERLPEETLYPEAVVTLIDEMEASGV